MGIYSKTRYVKNRINYGEIEMKDGRFETQAEIFQALLDSKKIKRNTWGLVALS